MRSCADSVGSHRHCPRPDSAIRGRGTRLICSMTSSGVPTANSSSTRDRGTFAAKLSAVCSSMSLRDQVLHAGEVCSHRMFRTVTSPVFGWGVEREHFRDVGFDDFVDLVTGPAGDDESDERGSNRHRIPPGIRGGGAHDLKLLTVFGCAGRPGNQPSAYRPVARIIRGPCAAIQISGHLPRDTAGARKWHCAKERTVSRGDQLAARIPQRADGGHGFLEASHGFGPVDAVGSVAFSLPGPDTQDARPRVSKCNEATACAVTAGLRRPVSVTATPSRIRPSLLRPAR